MHKKNNTDKLIIATKERFQKCHDELDELEEKQIAEIKLNGERTGTPAKYCHECMATPCQQL